MYLDETDILFRIYSHTQGDAISLLFKMTQNLDFSANFCIFASHVNGEILQAGGITEEPGMGGDCSFGKV